MGLSDASLPSFFLPLAITMPLIMVGIWAGATFCSFVRARMHIPKWNCRRFAPDRYSRDGFYSNDGICRALRYRASPASDCSLALSSPHPILDVFFEARCVSIFSLFLSVERRIEPQRYKGCPRCVKPPSTRRSRIDIPRTSFTPRSDIIPFPQCRESRICHETLFALWIFSSSELGD